MEKWLFFQLKSENFEKSNKINLKNKTILHHISEDESFCFWKYCSSYSIFHFPWKTVRELSCHLVQISWIIIYTSFHSNRTERKNAAVFCWCFKLIRELSMCSLYDAYNVLGNNVRDILVFSRIFIPLSSALSSRLTYIHPL